MVCIGLSGAGAGDGAGVGYGLFTAVLFAVLSVPGHESDVEPSGGVLGAAVPGSAVFCRTGGIHGGGDEQLLRCVHLVCRASGRGVVGDTGPVHVAFHLQDEGC